MCSLVETGVLGSTVPGAWLGALCLFYDKEHSGVACSIHGYPSFRPFMEIIPIMQEGAALSLQA